MWSNVVFPPDVKVPPSRSKHASVLHGQFLYLLGGRNGNVPLRDFWRFCISENTWTQLDTGGQFPGCLQEHTMVGYRDNLYVFGGEVGFSNGVETPLWIYNIPKNEWRKFISPKRVVTPKGRRSHTATVYQDSMYIYGGYQDLKGSTSELWTFHFVSETWHLVSQGGTFDCPPPRHRHSAVLHDNAMWVFGGMTDLQERSDFWRFDFVSRRWRPVKSKPGPGCLHSHCAVKFLSVMMLFGGEREGQTLSDVWRFHFATEFWERLHLVNEKKPMPRAQTTAFIFSQFTTRGAVHYMGLPEQDYFGSQPEVGKHPISVIPASSLPQKPQCDVTAIENRAVSPSADDDIYEEIDEFPSKPHKTVYKFKEDDNCLIDDNEPPNEKSLPVRKEKNYDQIPRELFRELRRPLNQNFQRLSNDDEDEVTTASATSKGVNLKDLVPAKMSQMNLSRLSNYCGYSVFSNESTESLDVDPDSSFTGSPSSVKMLLQKSRTGSLTLSTNTEKEQVDDETSSLTRDPSSIPNFADLQLQKMPDEELQYENGSSTGRNHVVGVEKSSTSADVRRSDSNYTFQSYDCSSRSSTLSSSVNGKPPSKTSDVILKGGEAIKLIDLEEEDTSAYFSDEFSSLSGYESIEAGIDRINFALKKNLPTSTLESNTGNKMSFANPHYLCPDVKTLVEKRRVTNIFGENMSAVSKDPDDYQHFAQALNSPADSLYSDYQDLHARLKNDLVEMSHLRQPNRKSGHPLPPLPAEGRPKSAIIQESSLAKGLDSVRLRNKEQPETANTALASCSATPMPARKARPVSTGSIRPDLENEKKNRDVENRNQLQLLMYIVGGREVGQVTVFKRPISMWKLDLTRTF